MVINLWIFCSRNGNKMGMVINVWIFCSRNGNKMGMVINVWIFCSRNGNKMGMVTNVWILQGLLLYNGPITAPDSGSKIVSDFISIELSEGRPRLLIDFGSGTLEMKVCFKFCSTKYLDFLVSIILTFLIQILN